MLSRNHIKHRLYTERRQVLDQGSLRISASPLVRTARAVRIAVPHWRGSREYGTTLSFMRRVRPYGPKIVPLAVSSCCSSVLGRRECRLLVIENRPFGHTVATFAEC